MAAPSGSAAPAPAAAAAAAAGSVNDMDVIEALCFFSRGSSSPPPEEENESSSAEAPPPPPPPPLPPAAAAAAPQQLPPKLKIQCDPPSSKARFKCYSTLVRLCSRYGRSPTDHHISVCEGRKTVHVLNDGEVDSLACFINNETPGASFRVRKPTTTGAATSAKSEMQGSYLRSIVVPNGWKVAVVDEGHLFTAEARVALPLPLPPPVDSSSSEAPPPPPPALEAATGPTMEYRFAAVNELGEEEEEDAPWYANLCEAFRKVSQPLEDKRQTKTHRYNGKLLLGLHYHNPQLKVQHFVRKQLTDDPARFPPGSDLRDRVQAWLDSCDRERAQAEEAQDAPPAAAVKRARSTEEEE